MKLLIVCTLFMVGLVSFSTQEFEFAIPKHFPKPSYKFTTNPLNEKKILLGRQLFYDPILSADNTISCESCHSPYSAFAHTDHSLSHGLHDSIGKRNAPALFNLAWQKHFMWDGAIHHLDVQALAPISHPLEMGSSINEVLNKLKSSEKYKMLFYEAYGDSLINSERTLKSIAQFLLTLVSANSKYDKVKSKQAKFTTQELNGYQLFQKKCSSCHPEPLFTNNSFENNGLAEDSKLKDIGRVKISQIPQDSFKFKVPSLRNIEYTYPYMHDGRFKKLSEVLNHYTKGITNSSTLARQLKNSVRLSANEKVDIISFLLTLSDSAFVFNSQFIYPKK